MLLGLKNQLEHSQYTPIDSRHGGISSNFFSCIKSV
nr:MAG TPA: hypothetical protein [Caudoviricetes sp.]